MGASDSSDQVAGERPRMEKVARMLENMQCRSDEIEEAAEPVDQDPIHHEIYEEDLAHPGTPPPPPAAFTP